VRLQSVARRAAALALGVTASLPVAGYVDAGMASGPSVSAIQPISDGGVGRASVADGAQVATAVGDTLLPIRLDIRDAERQDDVLTAAAPLPVVPTSDAVQRTASAPDDVVSNGARRDHPAVDDVSRVVAARAARSFGVVRSSSTRRDGLTVAVPLDPVASLTERDQH
jgi:hypothetical protein